MKSQIMKFQIIQRETRESDGETIVRDVWEAEPRELLRCLASTVGVKGREPWPADLGDDFKIDAILNGSAVRTATIVVATPQGCRKARPCVGTVDLLAWCEAQAAAPEEVAPVTPDEAAPVTLPEDPFAGHKADPNPCVDTRVLNRLEPDQATPLVRDLGALSHMFDEPAPSEDSGTRLTDSGVGAWLASNRRQRRGVSA